MRIYLDNCCFNRPYDDQSCLRIYLETQAKIQVQAMIKDGEVQLVTSYILRHENSKSPFSTRKSIMAIGVKDKDALHVACALSAKCKYFLTTDDRLIKKYHSEKMLLLTPIDFVILEGK